MLLFSHYTRLEPGTNERKNKQKLSNVLLQKVELNDFRKILT